MLWFEVDEQEEIFINYLPEGAAYKQAAVQGSNFNNLVKTLAGSFQWLAIRFNSTFRGLFVTESDVLVDQWKKDYNVPNTIFKTSKANRVDVFTLKYLMRGNTEWHFRAIANIYLIDVIIEAGSKDNPPEAGKTIDYMTVKYIPDNRFNLPYDIPHHLRFSEPIEKLKQIYAIIKPSNLKIIYEPLPEHTPFPIPRVLFPENL